MGGGGGGGGGEVLECTESLPHYIIKEITTNP